MSNSGFLNWGTMVTCWSGILSTVLVGGAMLLCPCSAAATDARPNNIAIGSYYYKFNSRSGDLEGPFTPEGVRAEVRNTQSVALVYTRHIAENWSIVAALGWPPSYELFGAGAAGALGNVGTAKAISPVFLIQKHFRNQASFSPFVGAGASYSHYSSLRASESLNLALGGATNLRIDDSIAAVVIAGFDTAITEPLVLTFSASYIDLASEILLTTGGIERSIDVEFRPLIFRATLGYRF